MSKCTLGLCMIVKNEEAVIGRCLNSVKGLFDEIVIVDTGSTDKTKEIVKKYTDKVYDFKWIYDFSAARNFSFSKSTCDYIMWLDADDVVYPSELKKLKEFKPKIDSNIEAYRMYYSYIQDKDDNPILQQQRVRIIKNRHENVWEGKIHEVIIMEKVIPTLDITIHHKKEKVLDPNRNIDIYNRMYNNKEQFSTRDLFMYSLELSGHHEYEKALEMIKKMFQRKNDYTTQRFYYDQATLVKTKIYKDQNKSTKEIKKAIFQYLEDFVPSPGVCCELGELYIKEKNYPLAIFWYKNALKEAKTHPEDKVEYNEFLPYYSMAYCYYSIGDYKKACYYSTKAVRLNPKNETAVKNHEAYELVYNDYKERMKQWQESMS